MKRFVPLFFSFVILLFAADVFGQATAGSYRPYRNLAVWYATQSAPTPLEKAQWALDDINAYRTSIGLAEFTDSILSANEPVTKAAQKRFVARPFLKRR